MGALPWGSILSFLFPLFEIALRYYSRTESQKKDYIAFLEIMARNGVKAALNRLSAQEQIDAVDDAWKKEEKNDQTP